jgi:hypothetical protein
LVALSHWPHREASEAVSIKGACTRFAQATPSAGSSLGELDDVGLLQTLQLTMVRTDLVWKKVAHLGELGHDISPEALKCFCQNSISFNNTL